MKVIINNDPDDPPSIYDNCTFQVVVALLITPITIIMLLDNFGILI